MKYQANSPFKTYDIGTPCIARGKEGRQETAYDLKHLLPTLPTPPPRLSLSLSKPKLNFAVVSINDHRKTVDCFTAFRSHTEEGKEEDEAQS